MLAMFPIRVMIPDTGRPLSRPARGSAPVDREALYRRCLAQKALKMMPEAGGASGL